MASSDKHPIRNGVIAGVIVLVLSPLVLKLTGWFPSILTGLSNAADWLWTGLGTTIPIPVWLLIVFAVFAVPPLLLLIRLFCLPPWRNYKQDRFDGMVWRWEYDTKGNPVHLDAFCPSDDTRLLWLEAVGYRSVQFKCETCGEIFGPIIGRSGYARDKVSRQIERKIRTDSWKEPSN